MADWKTHDGGPQPIANDIWVEVYDVDLNEDYTDNSTDADWPNVSHYRTLNQHLIDAARLEGIRLGLEAAASVADHDWPDPNSPIRNLDPATIAKEATNDT